MPAAMLDVVGAGHARDSRSHVSIPLEGSGPTDFSVYSDAPEHIILADEMML